ncbi:MAG TPA: hypothetical protein EYQ01_10125 [Nitrospira sp.]|nr:hypothetical protein [Candidatus Manganitrophaceae bacterium]
MTSFDLKHPAALRPEDHEDGEEKNGERGLWIEGGSNYVKSDLGTQLQEDLHLPLLIGCLMI